MHHECAGSRPGVGLIARYAWRLLLIVIFCTGTSLSQTSSSSRANREPVGGQNTPGRSQTPQTDPAPPTPEEWEDGTSHLLERELWFYGKRKFPLGFIPPGARLKALQHRR